MYTPAHFAVDDAFVDDFLHSTPAGDLVTSTDQGLLVTYLPLIFDSERRVLIAHMARNNEQWRLPPRGEACLVLHGSDAYISPTWYAAKAENGRVVPTYNYVTAHVYGELVVHDDEEWLESAVRLLSERHESGRDPSWRMEDAPTDYIRGQLRAIVGLELRISRIECKNKMSQNRPEADVPGIVAGLRADGLEQVSELVRKARRS